jgi:HSP20 family protein
MLTLWQPEKEMMRWSRGLGSLLEQRPAPAHLQSFSPHIDIEEHQASYILHADLPGIEAKDIDIQVDADCLIVSGQRELANQDADTNTRVRERSFGKFTRRFDLGSQVDGTKIEASYDKGVLRIVLPKNERTLPRQIPVSVH